MSRCQSKIKISAILICLLTSIWGKAQIRFIDVENKLPIPALNIYHETGMLIGLTDKNGIVHFLEKVDINRLFPMTITAQHISYTTNTIPLSTVDGKQVYELTPRTTVIDDVIINTKPREVVVLNGYYRSLETFNLQQKYFSDGIVEFYIPLTKGKPKYKLIDYRIFLDSVVTAEYNAKMGPFFQIPRVPEMTSQRLSERLAEFVRENDETHRARLLKKGKEVGYLTTSSDGDNLQLYIDKVLPDSVVNEKFFRIEARTLQSVHIENYTATELNHITPFDLTSLYQNIVGSIKRKSEYGHIPYEGLNEFYVLERRYISSEEYKSIEKELTKSIYKTPERSVYTSRFWEDLEKYNIPPLQPSLAEKLTHRLQLTEGPLD